MADSPGKFLRQHSRNASQVNPVDSVHEGYVHRRRVNVLAGHFVELIPEHVSVLDVGCGDGALAHLIAHHRPDLTIDGLDVLVRKSAHIPVRKFDGRSIPCDDESYDVVMMVDVVHHAAEPDRLLREAVRVAGRALLLKDHLLEGLAARATLRFMDAVGNSRHGVEQPGNYWSSAEWQVALSSLGLSVETWIPKIGLYPWPANLVFERSLHFIARLTHDRQS